MRLTIQAIEKRQVLGYLQHLLFFLAFITLGYVCYVQLDSWLFQVVEDRGFQDLLDANTGTNPTSLPTQQHKAVALPTNGQVGRLQITRLGLSVMVMEGTEKAKLRRAVGHIAGTALPGQSGNVGIAGHRDTFFRPLANIRNNDRITLTTLQGEYAYQVVSTQIVLPEETGVLAEDGTELLTLVTCYPFQYLGPAPQRFIVTARLIAP